MLDLCTTMTALISPTWFVRGASVTWRRLGRDSSQRRWGLFAWVCLVRIVVGYYIHVYRIWFVSKFTVIFIAYESKNRPDMKKKNIPRPLKIPLGSFLMYTICYVWKSPQKTSREQYNTTLTWVSSTRKISVLYYVCWAHNDPRKIEAWDPNQQFFVRFILLFPCQ